ncbi:hypothetical protein ABIE26_002676 [Pedobacter africanus]|uniref:Uncharacterized protein n=1 Tax=Pedobacter africanus TaxID=151894 RepID=A0ACC6KXL8_9SPHI|nr:hypothetical protein [Pedobacter africanus]MDR6783935.1 hypothetical protein [Pedobacter africanus]
MNTIGILMTAVCLSWCAQPERGAGIEISRSRADYLLSRVSERDPWERMPDASSIAWHEAATLSTLVDMYEATEDPRYLEALARRGDRLLSHRDDKRGVTDGSGKSRPAWSMGYKYVVAKGDLKDQHGKAIISIRSTPYSNNQLTHVEVAHEPGRTGRFTLQLRNEFWNREETFSNLSMDPADERFVEKVVNDPMAPYSTKAGTYTDRSNLIAVKVDGTTLPVVQNMTLQPIPLAYMGYIGIIYTPLLRCAELVKAQPALKHLQPATARFIKAAEESYTDAAARLWRNGPGNNEGYYLTCERGESFPADNVGAPFNFLGKHVCAELALYRLTGKQAYLDRSKKMCQLLKNRLQYHAKSDLYIWNYWYEPMTTKGWLPEDQLSQNVKYFKGAANVEDISHGALDIAMIVAAQQAGIVFDQQDVKRFANTLLVNVLTPDRKSVRRKVDGGTEYPAYFQALHGWADLAHVNPEVYKAIRQTYLNRGEESLAICAALLKWERKLKQGN